jgi:hypothetical protein
MVLKESKTLLLGVSGVYSMRRNVRPYHRYFPVSKHQQVDALHKPFFGESKNAIVEI